jgi:peptidoglycan hydrolase CwlO-like protein
MDLDAGIGGVVGAGVASVLDWLDRRRVDDKFSKLETEMSKMETSIATQHVELKSIEKSQDGTAKKIELLDLKIDRLLSEVGKLTGAMDYR